MKFCGECGYKLKQPKDIPSNKFSHPQSYTPKFLVDKILAHKSVIEGERKLVTVFFADVAGFTAFSEKLDPEQVHRIMDGAFRILMNEIHEYEGTINQFTGDGVMALFGAPVAHEDHAQRACHAALTIQRAMIEYGKTVISDFGVNLRMRVGLNTGPVVVGSIGDDLRMDYTAVGDTVNLAARMESTAKPGKVLVSGNTYRRARRHFAFAPLGKVKVKGREDPVDVYELMDKIEKRKSGIDRQIFSEMVGREKELNNIEIQVLKAVNGEGSVVNIIGEAGVGKSRLVAELKKREAIHQAALLEGRAVSMGRNLSFHPVIDLLNQWARIGEHDSGATALKKLGDSIRRVFPEGMQEVLPFVATLMGMKLSGRYKERIDGIDGEALEKLVQKNVRDLLARASERTPLVIVMEDLHWADTSSIELMETLMRLVGTHRVLFVNVFRPGHRETGDRIVETIKEKLSIYYMEIVLHPLDKSMSETLINNMLKIRGLSHFVVDRIIERAGGNPFFIEEVVRSFIDEKAVVAKEGAFEVTEKIHTMVIPHTINDVLMARIDRLEEKTRHLVKVASVIGRSFFYRILAELVATDRDIDKRLSYLIEIQLIQEQKRMHELEYLFKHALTQEVVYESILLQKRKELHRQVAQIIESKFTDHLSEFYGTLAYHYNMADDLNKTEEYMEKAGEKAMKASASSEVISYYKQVIDLYIIKYGDKIEPKKLARMQKSIAQALLKKGNWREAVVYFDNALKNLCYFESTIKPVQKLKFIMSFIVIIMAVRFKSPKKGLTPSENDIEIFEIINNRAISLLLVDPMRMSLGFFPAAKKIFGFDISKSQALFDTMCIIGNGFAWTGISYDLAKRTLNLAINSLGDKENSIVLHAYKLAEGFADMLFGKWDFEIDLKSVDKMITTGNFESAVGYLCFSGPLSLEKGDFPMVTLVTDRLEEIRDVYNNEHSTTDLLELNAIKAIKLHHYEQAFRYVEKGVEHLENLGHKAYKVSFLGLKLQIEVLTDNLSKATETISEIRSLIKEVGMINIAPFFYSRYVVGVLLYHRANLIKSINEEDRSLYSQSKKQTQIWCKKALKTAKKFAPILTETLRLAGDINWLIDNKDKAFIWYYKSIQEGERLGSRLELSRSYFEVGKRLIDSKSKNKRLNGITGEEYLEKAQVLFKEMGLNWDLKQLKKVKTSIIF
jgi:class 3 adenylate cyclase/tetratricopeptide (TPR) repeat protein